MKPSQIHALLTKEDSCFNIVKETDAQIIYGPLYDDDLKPYIAVLDKTHWAYKRAKENEKRNRLDKGLKPYTFVELLAIADWEIKIEKEFKT